MCIFPIRFSSSKEYDKMGAMNIEVQTEKKQSLYEKVLATPAMDKDSYKQELLAQLELIAGKKNLTLEELKKKAESSIAFDEDLNTSLRLFTILSGI